MRTLRRDIGAFSESIYRELESLMSYYQLSHAPPAKLRERLRFGRSRKKASANTVERERERTVSQFGLLRSRIDDLAREANATERKLRGLVDELGDAPEADLLETEPPAVPDTLKRDSPWEPERDVFDWWDLPKTVVVTDGDPTRRVCTFCSGEVGPDVSVCPSCGSAVEPAP